jgi:peptide-methionine (S)-S-oxide reductase
MKHKVITVGMGCFWCAEAIFTQVDGVTEVTSGYAGGWSKKPTYEEVCLGITGHAEVVQIEYSPDIISLENLLLIFFKLHDPTTPNKQGTDVGTQYRSIILYSDNDDESICNKSLLEAQKQFSTPIVTEIQLLKEFYPAEGYHRKYYENNTNNPYCQIVINPKLENLKKINP